MVLIPKRLQEGDLIGVVSPSNAVTKELRPQLKEGVDYLRKHGFRVRLGENALKREDRSAGTPEQRADDINSMFSDDEVSAIICSLGGGTANTCLPLIDYPTLRKNPKIFLGISDITVLLNAFHAKTGLVTFHGNDVAFGFGRKPTRYDVEEFEDRLIRGKIGKVNKNSKWRAIRSGSGEGKLLGGNIHSLLKLAGTPYQPDFRNSILFLEAFQVDPDECKYQLSQLQQIGAFERLNGILIGYIWGLQSSAKRRRQTQMEDIIRKTMDGYDFPIVKCDDFGHNCPNTTLPVGARVRLEGQKGKEPELEITEECVN